MIYSKTPFRVSFFGGGTDFKSYFKRNKSIVIGTAIDKYIYVFISNFYSNLFDHKIRLFYKKNEAVNNVKDIKHKVIKKAFELEGINKDIELHVSSELPSYIGLGSSSSFVVGLLNILNFRKNKKLSKDLLAKRSIIMEQKYLKENVGYQDQILASYGGLNSIIFHGNNFEVKKLITKFEISALINNLFLVFTGIQRRANDIENKKFSPDNKKNKYFLDNINQISFEAEKCFLNSKTPDFFGELLHQTWVQKKKIHKIVSNKIIDDIYEMGIDAGASGGKLLGAGAGGFVLFYVDKKKHNKFSSVFKNRFLKFNIDYYGSKNLQIK